MREPRNPWWKRKRWISAAALWLVMIYPLGYGPAMYVANNSRVSVRGTAAAFYPTEGFASLFPAPVPSLYASYVEWWYCL